MPPVEAVGRGDVKTPPLWHTAAKMPIGRWYTDGSFHGPFPLMASSMELEKDRSFDALASSRGAEDQVGVRVGRSVTSGRRAIRIRSTRRWPREAASCSTRRTSAATGAMGPTTAVATCNGRASMSTSAPIARRLDVVSPGFIAAFDASPLAAEGSLVRSRGYAATPLTGVWANFPYLHNGSVPTLHHLLGPVWERPQLFEILAARRLDRERVGSRSTPTRETGCSPVGPRPPVRRKTATGSTPRVLDVPTQATISGRQSARTPIGARSSSTSKHSK